MRHNIHILFLIVVVLTEITLALIPPNQALTGFQQGPILVIYVYPSVLQLRQGATGTVRILVHNYGSSPAINTSLHVLGPSYVNLTSDGIRWGSNLTVRLGAVPGGKDVPVTFFVKLLRKENATVQISLIADNADPSLSSFVITAVESEAPTGESTISSNGHLIVVVFAIIGALTLLGIYINNRSKFLKTRSSKKKKRKS
ncbi:hypothetical protein MA03_05045 [Infirmifilum uzonense]|jgi:hypothetical protein|uniref:CARDB domain-containing protein n=1 Tax=Infirmifilum uzonense TaxID=1550241 RepID=A0A0F7FIJ6_9CREN|nr:hypothetical protein [Infirmifilum uzonense]AKG38765.1 hypothetical protein MA03_05045 [Infirmifilum uzonense]